MGNPVSESVLVACYAVQVVLFTVLAVYTFYWYFWIRVRKLKQNSFHLLMFSLILMSCLNAIAQGTIRFFYFTSNDATTQQRLNYVCVVTFFLYEGFDFSAHCLFVMKYWLVAKKIEQVFKPDQDINSKADRHASLYLLIMMIWVWVVMLANCWLYWTLPENSDVESFVIGFFTFTPPFIFFAFLTHAFVIMRRLNGYF